MLILSRKAGESIIIGDNITIRVISLHDKGYGRVRLAVEAPPETNVLRGELVDDKRGERT